MPLDFHSFYASSAALRHGVTPYLTLRIPYLASHYEVGQSLNPPIFLMLMSPLSRLSPHAALITWSLLSFILGLFSAFIAFKWTFSKDFLKQHQLTLYSIYLSLFSTLATTGIGQIGSCTAFFLMMGYDLYRRGRDGFAAVFWGIIIAIKLFPGLLFFYVLRQRRYNMLGIMVMTVFVLCLIPVLVYNMDIYSNYFKLIHSANWYGDSWNASIYGFLFRWFSNPMRQFTFIQCLYNLLAIGCIAWYVKKIYSIRTSEDSDHRQFCLTLVMMLLISPFGWIYYFPIILFPLLITGSQAMSVHATKNTMWIWFACLCLINYPAWIIHSINTTSLFKRLSIESVWFYGLLLLACILSSQKVSFFRSGVKNISNGLILPLVVILAFEFLISLCCIWQL